MQLITVCETTQTIIYVRFETANHNSVNEEVQVLGGKRVAVSGSSKNFVFLHRNVW
ncbi:hypothetical protein FOCC_FOCC015436 [Frankliniella occidentalis]|nr:hypothetical protein FOCC_FOCC015436 [Frankliniella occidentalis]